MKLIMKQTFFLCVLFQAQLSLSWFRMQEIVTVLVRGNAVSTQSCKNYENNDSILF